MLGLQTTCPAERALYSSVGNWRKRLAKMEQPWNVRPLWMLHQISGVSAMIWPNTWNTTVAWTTSLLVVLRRTSTGVAVRVNQAFRAVL
jgi:hypothetical protein